MKNIICPKCCGYGKITKYNHVEEGICFKCGGCGYIKVDDNTIDTIKQIREDGKQEQLKEKEFFNLYKELKNKINGTTWNTILDNTNGTENLTRYEHKTLILKAYLNFTNEFKIYVNDNKEYLLSLEIEEYLKIKNEFMKKYVKNIFIEE